MLRYVCPNPNCLHTFLSPDLLRFKKCDKCGCFLSHIGRPDHSEPYPLSNETLEELKEKYVKLREKALRIGLLPSERLTVGRAVRKISFDVRRKLLQESGLWQDDIIYKYVMIDGLLKMVVDKNAMNYEKRKSK